MKNFFKTFGAALLAFFVGTVLMWFVLFSIIGGIAASFGQRQVYVPSDAVLVVDFRSGIVDSPDNRFGAFDVNRRRLETSNTMLEVTDAVRLAASDPNIKGIYINIAGSGAVNYGNMEELRSELLRFKESGKFVVAYNEVYSQPAYWLSSAADRVFIHPEGFMDWRGVAANVMFYKGLLDKLGVDVEIIRHGTFKSAVEPYITDRMSPANRLQMTTLVNSLWDVMLADISESRGIPADKLRQYAEEMAVREPDDALRFGFVDGVLYRDEMADMLSALCRGEELSAASVSEHTDFNAVSLGDYIAARAVHARKVSKNKVALIYADGQIVDGESYPGAVGGATLADQIAQAREDNGVKAVVLRVNSPGGSALASDVVWREMELCREVKPVVVSMGGVAASGGYYISAPADVILADRTTQTGSIGVFGMKLNLEKTLRDKVGITVDVAKTNAYADMGSVARPLMPAERAFLQGQVEKTYGTFVEHVAAGRNMTFEQVDEIGQGRVWLGTGAEKNGLVDGFGGLSDAVALAADRAGIAADFRVYEILSEPDSFAAFLSMFSARMQRFSAACVHGELGEAFVHYDMLSRTLREDGVMALMPYTISFE